MKFMNSWDIDRAVALRAWHPVLGPAARTLRNLRDAADANSDGWAYWPKPARAARKLMELLEGNGKFDVVYGPRDDVTVAQLRSAYSPIKAFRTKSGLKFDIEEVKS
jgi:hypothetical protein